MTFAARRDALRALLRQADEVDALLVTDVINVRYLTGFTGSNATLVVGLDGVDTLCTDGRYALQVAAEVPDLEAVIDRAGATALVTGCAAQGVGRLGFESDVMTVDAHAALAEAAEPVTLHRVPGLVQRLRAVKDAGEVATLGAACAAADAAFAALLAAGGIRPGRTEREVALDLELRMRDHGATAPAFESIVAAGRHSAEPHHRPTGAELRCGDLVTLDFGALVDGYHSDMTRTFAVGDIGEARRTVYDTVARSQQAGVDALRAGVDAAEVDAACREVIAQSGWAHAFVHGTGHGVGLDIHEEPRVSVRSTATLRSGHVVTVEPGIYLEDLGGVRIEDTLLVTDDGCERLTLASKDPEPSAGR